MITLGNGVDIIENKRISKLTKNSKFVKRVFSKSEINFAIKKHDKVSYYAKRFAAKEAFLKAIGTGLRKGINFTDITIKNNFQGKPFIIINDKIKKIIKKKFKTSKIKIYLSLSDEKKYSIAYVVLNKI